MLNMDNDRKTLDLFKVADEAQAAAINPFNVLIGGQEEKDARYEALKQEILAKGLWFEFCYYVNAGKYNVFPDANLGKGLTYVFDRNAFYLNGKHISADQAYDILSNNGELDVYTVVGNLSSVDGLSFRQIKMLEEALDVERRGEWK